MTTEPTESTALAVVPTDAEVEAELARIQAEPSKFITADRDTKPEDLRALAYFSQRYRLDALAGEVMIYQSQPYITLDGMIRKARESGLLDYLVEIAVDDDTAAQLQAQIPPLNDEPCKACSGVGELVVEGFPTPRRCRRCRGTGETIDRAYFAGAILQVRGSTEASKPTYQYVLESERSAQIAAAQRNNRQAKQPVVRHTQKQALARAKRKAIRDSGIVSQEVVSEIDAAAAMSAIEGMVLRVIEPDQITGGEEQAGTEIVEEPKPLLVPNTDALDVEPAEEFRDLTEENGEEPEAEEPEAETVVNWEPPDDFAVIENPQGDWPTIVAHAKQLGYSDTEAVGNALLEPTFKREQVQRWLEDWSVRAICHLLTDIAHAASASRIDVNTVALTDLATNVHRKRYHDGESFNRQPTWVEFFNAPTGPEA